MPSTHAILRLGTRSSLLARMQSLQMADELEKRHPGLRVELKLFKTSGDRIAERPLHELGGKGLFTKELEQALLAGEVDFAVHSFKDVPVTMPLVEQDQLIVAAVAARADPRDALVSANGCDLSRLPRGARVGTGSLRRRCQLLARRPDLRVQPIRGNIDTRLKKRRDGAFDAIVLAMAGLRRSGLYDADVTVPLDPAEMLPAAGQGALALQCRRADERTRELLSVLDDPPTAVCVGAERALVAALGGDCHSPIAALAEQSAGRLLLRAAVGARDGGLPVLAATAETDAGHPMAAVQSVLRRLTEQGAASLLKGTSDSG